MFWSRVHARGCPFHFPDKCQWSYSSSAGSITLTSNGTAAQNQNLLSCAAPAWPHPPAIHIYSATFVLLVSINHTPVMPQGFHSAAQSTLHDQDHLDCCTVTASIKTKLTDITTPSSGISCVFVLCAFPGGR